MEQSIWMSSKSSSRGRRQLRYFPLSLSFSQWNNSATWSTLCKKKKGGGQTQPHPSHYPLEYSLEYSHLWMLLIKIGRSWVSATDIGYVRWNCKSKVLQSSVIWVRCKSIIIRVVQGSYSFQILFDILTLI